MELRGLFKKSGSKRIYGGLFSALLILGMAACKTQAGSDTKSEVDPKLTEKITAKLEAARPGLKVHTVAKTNVPGVLKVDLLGNGAIYMIEDGDYFFVGDMYKVESTGFVNVTEQEKAAVRGPLIASVKAEDTISFKPKGEVKAVINVFTDVDCGYCQKLHREVPELNKRGIEVRYLAFPRAGIPSGSYDKIATAWCAENPQDTLTKVKNREPVEIKVCEGNPVSDQLQLGQKMGVSGTPAIVLMNGDLIPGYVPADRLAARLGIN